MRPCQPNGGSDETNGGSLLRSEHHLIDTVRVVRRLFASDSVLPSQFFATPHRQTLGRTGEHRLLVALLEEAIGCFQKHVRAAKKPERRLFKEAEQWIMGDNDEENRRLDADARAFTFRYVCEALDIEPEYLRGRLRRWRNVQRAHG